MSITQTIQVTGSLDEALAEIVGYFGAHTGTVHCLAEDGCLHLAAATGSLPAPVLDTIRTIPVGKGMAGLAVEQRRPVDACNIQTDTTGNVRPGARATGLGGAVVVPMFRGEQVVGSLGIGSRNERSFSSAEIDALLEAGRAFATKFVHAGAPA